MDAPVKLEVKDGIANIILNRAKAYNSFDLEMIRSVSDKLSKAGRTPYVEGVIVTGNGKAFCAGGDLKWISEFVNGYGAAFHELAGSFHQTILKICQMGKPVVAAINGMAAGGGFSLALACDFRIMEKSAVLKQGYTSNGLSLDGGGTYTLPRLIGLARALEIVSFDEAISAEQALSWGLVTEVVEDGQAVGRSVELIKKLRKVPLSSFAAVKKLVRNSFNTSFESQLEKERESLSLCGEHPDGREGIQAFLERRKPSYRKGLKMEAAEE